MRLLYKILIFSENFLNISIVTLLLFFLFFVDVNIIVRKKVMLFLLVREVRGYGLSLVHFSTIRFNVFFLMFMLRQKYMYCLHVKSLNSFSS